MKRTALIAAVLAVLGAALLFAIPVSSSQSWKSSFNSKATVDQEANSNIGQNAKVLAKGWSPFADADQTANSNIGQNAKVFSSTSGFASVDQEANSNIGQNAKVFAKGKHAKATVDQTANSNIQQNAKVVSKSPFDDKHERDGHDGKHDSKSDESRYGICVIGVDSPCNAERWE